jgi:hypothetical protein
VLRILKTLFKEIWICIRVKFEVEVIVNILLTRIIFGDDSKVSGNYICENVFAKYD